jgi:Holliday junction resolvase
MAEAKGERIMASRGSGAKQKGSRAERRVAEALRRVDPNASRMPLSGADSHLKGDVRTDLPYCFEVKCQERVSLWKFWEQAVEQAHYASPVLCITANYRPLIAVVSMDTLVHLLHCEKQLEHYLAVRHDFTHKDNSKPKANQSKYKRKVSGEVVER